MSIESGVPDLEHETKEADKEDEKVELEDSSRPDLKKRSLNNFGDLKYKTYTEEYDEIIKAEDLESSEELSRLRKNLDQQLLQLKNFISKLANNKKIRISICYSLSSSLDFILYNNSIPIVSPLKI